MTVRTAWLVNDTMSGEDIRLSQTAAMTHDTAIRSRSGVIPAPSNPLAVSIGSGMVVNVAAGQLSIGGQRAGAQGTYVVTNDATLALTIANGDAAQPRTDAIVGYVRDTTYGDTTQVGGIAVITGVAGVSFPTPTYTGTTALGTAVLLGTIKVLANTTSGGGGLSGMGAALTDQRVYTAASGGMIPVANATARAAVTAYDGLQVVQLDTGVQYIYRSSAWWPLIGTAALPLTYTATIAASGNFNNTTTGLYTPGGTWSFTPSRDGWAYIRVGFDLSTVTVGYAQATVSVKSGATILAQAILFEQISSTANRQLIFAQSVTPIQVAAGVATSINTEVSVFSGTGAFKINSASCTAVVV